MTSPLKKCLLVGINYTGSDLALNGCINDSMNLKTFLTEKKYFTEQDFVIMNDNQEGAMYPTRDNMMKQFKELVRFANQNKNKQIEMFVSYSGHGHSVKDTSGDEEDGKDEVLCPVDCMSNGFITDDYLKQEFVDLMPSNVDLVILIDACHSGTMLDLKYNYAINKLGTCNVHEVVDETDCDVVMLSGCQDDQTSSDAYLKDYHEGKYEHQGAMTASFIANYVDGITYARLIRLMRRWLKNSNFTQVPQLSSGKSIKVRTAMLLSSYD